MIDEFENKDRVEKMEIIFHEVTNLKVSPLYIYRIENNYLPVIGEGSLDAKIMFVGEAPGKNEAKTGKPFCGKSGQILDELLLSINLKRKDIYITNIVKDRPEENRDPTGEEIEIYGPFLDRQIEIIKPQIIATLGRYSMQYIMEKMNLSQEIEPISKAHGKSFETKTSYGKVRIVPLYHPAASIYNQKLKDVLRKDFATLCTKGRDAFL